MLTRPESFRTVRFVLTATGALALILPLAAADEAVSVWGMNAGDRFLVSVVIVKQTDVTIDDQPPIRSETTDKLRIEYRVVQVSTNGEAICVARLQRPNRETDKASPDSLKSAAGNVVNLEDLLVVLHVDSEGIVQRVSTADKESILANVASPEPSALRLLEHACPDEVIASWFGRPFWIACHPEDAKPGHTWNRADDIAMGEFGTLRNSNDITIAGGKTRLTDVEISGTGRFVPLVVPQTDSQFSSSILKDVTAELDQFSGTARMFLRSANEDKIQPIRKRPQFDSMELTIRLHGQGLLQKGQSDPPQQVAFQQTQIQSWNLVEFEFGRPEIFFNFPVPVDAK